MSVAVWWGMNLRVIEASQNSCIDKLIKRLKEDSYIMDDVPLRGVPLDCEVTVALRRERLALNLKDCLQEGGVLKL